MITMAHVNRSIIRGLRTESRSAAKSESKTQIKNRTLTQKRRHAEDLLLARETGITLQELTA
jgi:hypothetical protein